MGRSLRASTPGSFLMVDLRWQETSEKTYIRTADLHSFVDHECAVEMADTLVYIDL
jgi:hypothetical protein